MGSARLFWPSMEKVYIYLPYSPVVLYVGQPRYVSLHISPSKASFQGPAARSFSFLLEVWREKSH
jgi:hypothetical protein